MKAFAALAIPFNRYLYLGSFRIGSSMKRLLVAFALLVLAGCEEEPDYAA